MASRASCNAVDQPSSSGGWLSRAVSNPGRMLNPHIGPSAERTRKGAIHCPTMCGRPRARIGRPPSSRRATRHRTKRFCRGSAAADDSSESKRSAASRRIGRLPPPSDPVAPSSAVVAHARRASRKASFGSTKAPTDKHIDSHTEIATAGGRGNLSKSLAASIAEILRRSQSIRTAPAASTVSVREPAASAGRVPRSAAQR